MADAHGSGPCVGNNMRVQVPSPAYKKQQSNLLFFSVLFLCIIIKTLKQYTKMKKCYLPHHTLNSSILEIVSMLISMPPFKHNTLSKKDIISTSR